MKKTIYALSISIILLSAQSLFAGIVVISVKGDVAYKAGQQWFPLAAGTALGEGTKISTGVKSTAVIMLDNHTVTIEPLTMLKIYKNSIGRGTSENHLGLRRGSIRAKVSRSREIKTSFKVSTPVATSSVRGTEEIISYGPNNGMVIRVIEGSVWGENASGTKKIITGGLVFHQKDEKTVPEPLIAEMKEASFVSVHDVNITKDEKSSHDASRGEYVDNSEDPIHMLDAESTARVNITFIYGP